MSTDVFGEMFSDFNTPEFEEPSPNPTPAPAPPADPEPPAFASIDDLLTPPDDPPTPTPTPTPAPQPPLQPSFDFGSTPTPAPNPAPPAPGTDPQAAIKEEFMRRLTSTDPTEAFIFAAQMGAEAAVQRMQGEFATVKGTTLMNTVNDFKSKMQAENPKLFAAIQKDFEGALSTAVTNLRKNPAQLAQISEAQVIEACTQFYDKAKAKALDRILARQANPNPNPEPAPAPAPAPRTPSYGTPPAPAPRNQPKAFVPKNDLEREKYELAKAAGLSDEDIADIL